MVPHKFGIVAYMVIELTYIKNVSNRRAWGQALFVDCARDCPHSQPVAGPSDQQDSERDTIDVLWGRGQGAKSSSPLAISVIRTLAHVMREV